MTASAHPHVPALTGDHAFPRGGRILWFLIPMEPRTWLQQESGVSHRGTERSLRWTERVCPPKCMS